MNEYLVRLMALAMLSTGMISAKEGIITFDSGEILRSSIEGKSIISQNEKDKDKAYKIEYEKQKEINEFRAEVEGLMKAGKLSEEDLQEKSIKMNRMQKMAKRDIEDAREEGEMMAQNRVLKFRSKVHKTAEDFCKKHGFAIAFDKATPGMVYASAGVDRTRDLVKELDDSFAKEKAKSFLTKNS